MAKLLNVMIETSGIKIFVRWHPDAVVTAYGPMTYVIEFLKAMVY